MNITRLKVAVELDVDGKTRTRTLELKGSGEERLPDCYATALQEMGGCIHDLFPDDIPKLVVASLVEEGDSGVTKCFFLRGVRCPAILNCTEDEYVDEDEEEGDDEDWNDDEEE